MLFPRIIAFTVFESSKIRIVFDNLFMFFNWLFGYESLVKSYKKI